MEAIVEDLILETLEVVVALAGVSVQVVALAVAKVLGGSMNLGAQVVLLERNKKHWTRLWTELVAQKLQIHLVAVV